MGDPQDSSRERKHEQAEAVREILDSVDPALEEHAYPTDPEELSARYGETPVELPNETESLGDVFDRLSDDEYGSPGAVREAVLREVSGASLDPTVAGSEREAGTGTRGAPESGRDDLESDEPAGTAGETSGADVPPDAEREAADVGTEPDVVDGPSADAAEPGDELTSETTESGEYAPEETLEDRDREGDAGEYSEREREAAASREEADEDRGAEPASDEGETDDEYLSSDADETERQ